MRKSLKLAPIVFGCLLPFAATQATPLTDLGTKAFVQSAEHTATGALRVPVVPMPEPSTPFLLGMDLLSVVAVTMLVRRRVSR
jgi:hypothetical protein